MLPTGKALVARSLLLLHELVVLRLLRLMVGPQPLLRAQLLLLLRLRLLLVGPQPLLLLLLLRLRLMLR